MNEGMPLLGAMLEPWFVRALLASLAVAVPASLLGVLLYFRRMSMLPDALAHAALPGVAAGYIVAGGPGPLAVVGGATASGLAATGLIDVLRHRAGLRPDVAVGVTYSVLFALGVVLVSTAGRRAHIDLDCVLFGNLLGVSESGIATLGIVAAMISTAILAARRALSFALFDPVVARAMGVPVAAMDRAIALASAVVCAAAFEATGSVLVLALFVLPAATAHKVASNFGWTLAASVSTGVAMSSVGLAAATALDVSPVGAIACTGGLLYVTIPQLVRAGRRLRSRRVDRGGEGSSRSRSVPC